MSDILAMHPAQPAFFGRKPVGRAALNRMHPVAHDMVVCDLSRDIANSENLANGDLSLISGTAGHEPTFGIHGGLEWTLDNDASHWAIDSINETIDFPWTVMYGLTVLALPVSGNRQIMAITRDGSFGAQEHVYFRYNAFNYFEYIIQDGFATATNINSSSLGAPSVGDEVVFCGVSRASNDHEAFLNGVSVGTDTTDHSSWTGTNAHSYGYGAAGASEVNSNSLGHVSHFLYVWYRALSNEECVEVSRRPYAPFGVPLILDEALPVAVWPTAAAGGLSIPIAAYHYNHNLGSNH